MNLPDRIADTIRVSMSSRTANAECSEQIVVAVRSWLETFATAVRKVDYETGKALFAPDVVGFGTVGVILDGLDILISSQWKKVWGVTTGFHFDMTRLTCGGEGDVAWAALPWFSQGRDRDGQPFDRRGRATYILHKRDGHWLAVHTHHSLDPSGKPPGA